MTGIDGLGYEPTEEPGWERPLMEALSPVIGICLAVGCAAGGISTAYENFRYEGPDGTRRSTPSRQMGNPVSQEAK